MPNQPVRRAEANTRGTNMRVEFVRSGASAHEGDALVVVALAGGQLSSEAEALDAQFGGALRRAVAVNRFTGEAGESLELLSPGATRADRVIVVGAGQGPLGPASAELAGGQAFQAAGGSGSRTLRVRIADPLQAAHAAFGVRLGG